MEENLKLYQDIANRTQGDIYVGVVGPVRTGKSTFIKRFMDLLVIPNIENEYKKERARDELPQSAGGRTIMTTEPKFIPNEAVEITIGDNLKLKTRLVDCVGYLVNNAIGYLEDDMPRMVKTPWFDEEIPFEQAAEIGTKKVIQEHSTIGILVTTDGSITDIPREDYVSAEERVVNELKALNKPFVIVLNSDDPFSDYTKNLAHELEEKYQTSVIPTDCSRLDMEDINDIFGKILYEFPIEKMNINFPKWVDGLTDSHWLKEELYSEIKDAFSNVSVLKQVDGGIAKLQSTKIINRTTVEEIKLGEGTVNISINLYEELFYKVLTEISGVTIDNEGDLFSTITNLAEIKKEYGKDIEHSRAARRRYRAGDHRTSVERDPSRVQAVWPPVELHLRAGRGIGHRPHGRTLPASHARTVYAKRCRALRGHRASQIRQRPLGQSTPRARPAPDAQGLGAIC